MAAIETLSAATTIAAKVLASAEAKEITAVSGSKLVKLFFTHVVEPKFRSRKSQDVVIDGLKRYLKYAEKASRFVPTIAIQSSLFVLEDVYEPLVLCRLEDRAEFDVVGYPECVFEKSRNVLVIDSAGMGKSTLTKYVLRRCLAELRLIPVLVELRRLKSGQTIEDFICDQLLGAGCSELCRSKLVEGFCAGDFLFMFDGYDEIDDSLRQVVSDGISEFSFQYSDCLFWLTSRPDDGLSSFSGFTRYAIKPLSEEKAHSLLRRYDKGRGKAGALIEKIGQIPQVQEFLGNPLLVTLLYKAYDYKATIPIKRNIFFRQVYDALFQDHDLSKQGAYERRKKSSLDIDDFHKSLRALGFVSFKTGRIQYTSEEFSGLAESAKKLVDPLKVEVKGWKHDLLSAVSVFVKDGADIRWSHKAFQDYFAAQFIYYDTGDRKSEFVGRLLRDKNVQKYENVIRLVAELDIHLVRDSFSLNYYHALVGEYEDAGFVVDDEVDFSFFLIDRCAEVFLISKKFAMKHDVMNLNGLPEFLSLVQETMGKTLLPIKQAILGQYEDYMVLSVFHGERWVIQALLGRLDPEAFNRAPFLAKGESKQGGILSDALGDGDWCSLNDIYRDSIEPELKISMVRAMSAAFVGGLASIASISSVINESLNRLRDDRIAGLLEGF